MSCKTNLVVQYSSEDSNSFYFGQTGKKFFYRYKEHLPKGDIRNIKSNFPLHVLWPVSYTHLDVYKRQVHEFALICRNTVL